MLNVPTRTCVERAGIPILSLLTEKKNPKKSIHSISLFFATYFMTVSLTLSHGSLPQILLLSVPAFMPNFILFQDLEGLPYGWFLLSPKGWTKCHFFRPPSHPMSKYLLPLITSFHLYTLVHPSLQHDLQIHNNSPVISFLLPGIFLLYVNIWALFYSSKSTPFRHAPDWELIQTLLLLWAGEHCSRNQILPFWLSIPKQLNVVFLTRVGGRGTLLEMNEFSRRIS